MGEGQELEFKFRVASAEVLDALIEHLGLADSAAIGVVRQVNHFFDTPSRALREQGLVLRLRDEGNRFLLTLKGGNRRAEDQTLTRRSEEEVEVPQELARKVLAGGSPAELLSLGEPFANVVPDGEELGHLGQFENERRKLPPIEVEAGASRQTVVFELDATTYAGDRKEFEIEAEVHGECDLEALERSLVELLRRAGIDWSTAPSKAARFFALLEDTR